LRFAVACVIDRAFHQITDFLPAVPLPDSQTLSGVHVCTPLP